MNDNITETTKNTGVQPKMRIYLDNCCFNRPYDDQSQLRILLETMTDTGSVTVNINQAEILNDGVDWLRQKFGDV